MGDPGFEAWVAEFEGERVQEFARAWSRLPPEVREALIVCRECEEQGAYMPTLLHTGPRGFFRQIGGASKARERL